MLKKWCLILQKSLVLRERERKEDKGDEDDDEDEDDDGKKTPEFFFFHTSINPKNKETLKKKT